MKKVLLLTWTVCFSFFSLTASAATLYQVELIVFKYNSPQDKDRETWPLEPAWPSINQAVNLKPPLKSLATTKPKTDTSTDAHPLLEANNTQNKAPEVDITELLYRYLPTSDFKLKSQERRLVNSKQYQVLLHVAWLQADGNSQPVHIYGGNVYNAEGQRLAVNSNSNQPAPIESDGSAQWQINGTVKVNKSRYYKVNTNLLLIQPNPKQKRSWFSNTPELPTFARYLLKQSQRMKRNELHYFDNPMFGTLVVINKADLSPQAK